MAQPFDIRGFMNAWNTQSVDRILDFYADDAELVVLPDTEPYHGKKGIRENVSDVTQGIEGVNGDLAWSVQEGKRVCALVHVTGKHTGEMTVSDTVKVPATNKDVKFVVGMFFELNEQGKIKRETDVADNLGILQQVGAMEKLTAGQR